MHISHSIRYIWAGLHQPQPVTFHKDRDWSRALLVLRLPLSRHARYRPIGYDLNGTPVVRRWGVGYARRKLGATHDTAGTQVP